MAATVSPASRNGGGLAALVRHRVKIVLAVVLFAVAGWFAASSLLTPSYSTSATITLSTDRPFDVTSTNGSGSQLGDSTQWAQYQAAVVTSNAVLDAAEASVPAAEQADFRDAVEVTASTDTNQITVAAKADTAADAKAIADAVATAYQTVTQQRVTDTVTAAVAALPNADTTSAAAFQLAAITYGSGVASIDLADAQVPPSPPYPWQIAVVGGLVGLLLSAGAVVWFAHVKQRVTAPPLAGVAELARWQAPPSIRALADPQNSVSRSSGVVLVGLQHLGHLRTPRLEVGSVLVTAASGNAGALATGLAASAARAGRRVVLIDADEGGSRLATLGAPVHTDLRSPLPEGQWREEVRPWVIGGGAIVGVLTLDARTLQPHVVGAGIQHLVEAGNLVIFVGGSVVRSPVAFAVAGVVDAVLVQIEEDPRAELVSKTLAQLSIAAPAVLAQVVVKDTGSNAGNDQRPAARKNQANAPVRNEQQSPARHA